MSLILTEGPKHVILAKQSLTSKQELISSPIENRNAISPTSFNDMTTRKGEYMNTEEGHEGEQVGGWGE